MFPATSDAQRPAGLAAWLKSDDFWSTACAGVVSAWVGCWWTMSLAYPNVITVTGAFTALLCVAFAKIRRRSVAYRTVACVCFILFWLVICAGLSHVPGPAPAGVFDKKELRSAE